MKVISLSGAWRMKRTDETKWLEATVPGSVLHDLLMAGLIPDPFYRDNEDRVKEIGKFDYEYEREFDLTEEFLGQEKIFLCCEGLDTLAVIRLNGVEVAQTENMHRTYEFLVNSLLKPGKNNIKITFLSPFPYIEDKQKQTELWGGDVKGCAHLRKAHYMFGWDWGPQLSDAGIWRPIYLKGYDTARFRDVYPVQRHQKDGVNLELRVRCERWQNGTLTAKAKIVSPQGEEFTATVDILENDGSISIHISNPELWWPNTYGEQPLYEARVELWQNDRMLETREMKIGLRTIRVKREKDEWGESFAFEVNGVEIFIMGADYIPEDNLLIRCNPARTEKLIRDAAAANFNSIRVWGGGIYPEDYFFDLCDRYGLVVWQDLMYACCSYELSREFEENIIRETENNMRRIRHHASLGMWCGNNEQEWAWDCWGWPKTGKLRSDYIRQFEHVLPRVAAEIDPETFYWPASPSSGGGFDNPNDENRGDVHYWDVWHGMKPFTDYRKFYFRFVSEFGFEAFPSMKTVESFTLPEDRNIFSYIMEKHQKCVGGNQKILYYLSDHFLYPKDFEAMLYASQVIQAEAIKYGVEHWRRHRGRCMGAIYWQLNDCWPVASWASIDSFGRWKALHYFARRFYAPVLLSANEEGTKVDLYLTNDTTKAVRGKVLWRLRDHASAILREGEVDTEVTPLTAVCTVKLDFTNDLQTTERLRRTYLEFEFMAEGRRMSGGTVLFTRSKHFVYLDPKLAWKVADAGDEFQITIRGAAYTRYVALDLRELDCVFSDNYFDLSAETDCVVTIKKSELPSGLSAEEIERQLLVRSIYDMA